MPRHPVSLSLVSAYAMRRHSRRITPRWASRVGGVRPRTVSRVTTNRLWTPTYTGLILANLGSSFIFYLLVPTMAVHATQAFGASPVEAGALASLFFVGAIGARLFGGYALERVGARRMALVAATLYLLTTLGYLVAPDLLTMMIVRTLNGLCFGFFSTAMSTAVMLVVPAHRRGEGAGFYGLGISLTIGLGPFAAITLMNGPGMTTVFWTAVACAVWMLLVLLAIRRGIPGLQQRPPREQRPSLAAQLIEIRALPIGLVAAFATMAYAGILTFLQSYTEGTPMATAATFYFLVYAGVALVTRPLVGRLQDRRGDDVIYPPALIALVAAASLMAVANAGWLLLVAAALLGLGFGSIGSAGQASAARTAPMSRTPTAVSTFYLLLDIGTGLGPILLGLAVPAVGFRGVFWIGAVFAACALAVYLVAARQGRPER